jgi:threonine aldolase
MRVIDLRSDTVTLPTPAMREAMRNAEVGDDVWGDDPTVKRLERMAAERIGKEATLLTVSGTMSNLVAVLTHCQRGDEMIVGSEAHMFYYEVGGCSALGGVHVRTVPNDARGMLDPGDVEAAIRTSNIHFPPTRLICLENTHNRCGGAVLTPDDTASVAEVAKHHEIPVYLDGARIFNAAVYLGIDVRELTRHATSLSFCLSKGLSAPIGAVLCGSEEFIARARKNRKMVGGGMRQAGIIAAAGIVALETMVERLGEDHANAQLLAQGLSTIPGIAIDPATVQTNIVMFAVEGLPPEEFQRRLAEKGVKISSRGGNRFRMVTHYGIERQDIEEALEIVRQVCKKA